MNVNHYISERKTRIESVLENYLPKANILPKRLHQAMRYAVLGPAKRLRPLLVYAAGESFGATLSLLDQAAAAIELIHSYSLVHDDLPAMDNDDFRRGQPSCHKAFDEATAILVGDALQALAFEMLAQSNVASDIRLAMIKHLAYACGSQGMAGGQALEFDSEISCKEFDWLKTIHQLKTGFLIRSSVRLGAIVAGVDSVQQEKLDHYASHLGSAYQIQDDLLDHSNDEHSFSYVKFLGVDEAKKKVSEHYQQALTYLNDFSSQSAQPLYWMAEYMIEESYRFF